MAFVIVTGLPCSGKSTFIAHHARGGEAVFKVDGTDNGAAAVVAHRGNFIKKHAKDAKAWIEASSMTPIFRSQLRGCFWCEVPMRADARTCLMRLAKSDRPNKEAYRRIILSKAGRD